MGKIKTGKRNCAASMELNMEIIGTEINSVPLVFLHGIKYDLYYCKMSK